MQTSYTPLYAPNTFHHPLVAVSLPLAGFDSSVFFLTLFTFGLMVLVTITERPVLGPFRFFDTFTLLAFVILSIALEPDAALDPARVAAFLDTAEEVARFSFSATRSLGGRDG